MNIHDRQTWHQLDHMLIIYASLQTDNHASNQFFTGQILFLTPNQQCQSTEEMYTYI